MKCLLSQLPSSRIHRFDATYMLRVPTMPRTHVLFGCSETHKIICYEERYGGFVERPADGSWLTAGNY